MNDFYQQNLKLMVFQRNIFLTLTLLSSVSLLIVTAFLFLKSDRVIVVPGIDKEFWVDSKHISPTYLEQYGVFLGELLLTKSAQSAPAQRTWILRHTDPSYATLLNRKLVDEEKKLAKENASYVFYPIDMKINLDSKEVCLIGDRTLYVSGKAISTERESYILHFSYQGSRLLLKGISAKEES